MAPVGTPGAPDNHIEEMEGLPGTSHFLGLHEQDPARVGVVGRLRTVEHVFQGLG
jgi:hypothetical protein